MCEYPSIKIQRTGIYSGCTTPLKDQGTDQVCSRLASDMKLVPHSAAHRIDVSQVVSA